MWRRRATPTSSWSAIGASPSWSSTTQRCGSIWAKSADATVKEVPRGTSDSEAEKDKKAAALGFEAGIHTVYIGEVIGAWK